jgi:hypothetical protein
MLNAGIQFNLSPIAPELAVAVPVGSTAIVDDACVVLGTALVGVETTGAALEVSVVVGMAVVEGGVTVVGVSGVVTGVDVVDGLGKGGVSVVTLVMVAGVVVVGVGVVVVGIGVVVVGVSVVVVGVGVVVVGVGVVDVGVGVGEATTIGVVSGGRPMQKTLKSCKAVMRNPWLNRSGSIGTTQLMQP